MQLTLQISTPRLQSRASAPPRRGRRLDRAASRSLNSYLGVEPCLNNFVFKMASGARGHRQEVFYTCGYMWDQIGQMGVVPVARNEISNEKFFKFEFSALAGIW